MTREYYSFGLTSLYFFTLITYYFLNALYPCNVILYINAPVRIYGATYYSTATTSDIVVAYNTSGPWNLMLSGHADY